MRRRWNTFFFAAVLGIAFFWCGGAAVQAQGGYAGAVLRMGVGSRSEAMGRAYTAVVGDPEGAFYNPATIPFMQRRTIDLSVRALSLDRTFAYAGFALKLQPKSKFEPEDPEDFQYGGLSLSWLHASVSHIDGRDFDGQKFDTFSNNQNILRFSFALRVRKEFAVGLGAHIFWNRFPGLGREGKTISSNSASLDLGVLALPLEGVWVGATIRNINGKFTWDTSALYERGTQRIDDFPRIWRVGVATTRLLPHILLAADVEGSEQFAAKFYFGGLYRLPQGLELRAGLRDGQPTLGGGYSFTFAGKQAQLLYAYVNRENEIDAEHIFSWAFSF